MRIIVRDGEHNLNIPFPTGLMVIGRPAGGAWAARRKMGVPTPQKLLGGVMMGWRRFRRHYPKWTLVEVESHEGEHVKIEL